jgi:peptidoglycan hydrolase-like protein with peptidoglycan-binding domain
VFTVYDREVLVRSDPLLLAAPELVEEIQRRLAARGIYSGAPTGVLDDPTRNALAAFAGAYNLEGRLREDERLSEMLVRELRDVTPDV